MSKQPTWSQMGLYSNLTNGVSQQPARVRSDSQQDEAVSMYPTTFHQMGMRPPLEVTSQLASLDTNLDIATNGYPYTHSYVRDTTESYGIFFDGVGRIFAYDKATGTQKTVNLNTQIVSFADTDIVIATGVITSVAHGLATETAVRWFAQPGNTLPTRTSGSISDTVYVRSITADTFSLHPTAADATGNTNVITYSAAGSGALNVTPDLYLFNTSPETGFFCLTYKDVTFVLNRSTVAAMSSTLSATRTSEALVHIKDYVSGATYSVTVNFGATSITVAPTGADVNAVAADLVTKLAAAGSWPAGVTLTQYGNVVHISKSTLTSVKVSDNRAATAIHAFMGSVIKPNDLTPYAPNGYIVKVTGASTTATAQDNNSADDQYYKFTADDGTGGSGTWVETLAPGIAYTIDGTTAPHILTRNASGQFDWTTIPWGTRNVGDSATNPDPIFIGQALQSAFLLGNRLGFVAGAQFISSRVGEENYYEFFRATTSSQLDDDPVFGSVPSQQVNKVYWPVAWNGELILFGDRADGVVSYGNKYSITNLNISTPTVSGISPIAAPILSGSDLFFITESGDYSNLSSYQIDPVTSLRSAESTTADYLGRYIPKNVKRVVGREKGIIVMLSTDERQKLYVMTYSKKESRLIQQGVVTWDFSSIPNMAILDVAFDGPYLYVTYKGPNGKFYMGKLDTSVGASDTGWARKCYLDHRMSATGSYNATTDLTTFTLPYALTDGDKRAAITSLAVDEAQYAIGEDLTIASDTDTTLVFRGDISGRTIYAGYGYTRYFIPNPISDKTTNPSTGARTANLFTELNVSRLLVGFFNSQYFKVEIISKQTGRTLSVREFIGGLQLDNVNAILDDNSTTFTGSLLVDGLDVSSDEAYVKISSDSHLPFFVDTIQWLASSYTAGA